MFAIKKSRGQKKEFMFLYNGKPVLASYNKTKRRWVTKYTSSNGSKNTPKKYLLQYEDGGFTSGKMIKTTKVEIQLPFLSSKLESVYNQLTTSCL